MINNNSNRNTKECMRQISTKNTRQERMLWIHKKQWMLWTTNGEMRTNDNENNDRNKRRQEA